MLEEQLRREAEEGRPRGAGKPGFWFLGRRVSGRCRMLQAAQAAKLGGAQQLPNAGARWALGSESQMLMETESPYQAPGGPRKEQ